MMQSATSVKITKSCLNCLSQFETYPSENKRFCSRKCNYEYQSKTKSSIVQCVHCSKEFKAIKSNLQKGWDKYCSKKCKGAALSKRNAPNWTKSEINCLECGKSFLVTPSRLKDQRGKFCSKQCRDTHRGKTQRGDKSPSWKGGKTKKTCPECGSSFEIFPSREKLIKYCSKECQYKWRSRTQKGENNPAWNGGLVTQICQCCQNTFQVKPSQVRKGNGIFCSKKCKGEWSSRMGLFSGENNPLWNGGSSFEPYPLTFNQPFKRQIRTRDRYLCAICLWYGNFVHHIDYIKENTFPENCITLCNSCHSKTNADRIYWQQALTPIAQERCQ